MSPYRRPALIVVIFAVCLMLSAVSRAAEIELHLSTEKHQYLQGEPVILRLSIDTTQLTSPQIQSVIYRDRAKYVLRVPDGFGFPPLPTFSPSVAAQRDRTASGLKEYFSLQPANLWWERGRFPLPEWTQHYLVPGSYVVHVENRIGVWPSTGSLRSNTVEFEILAPTGGAAAAWAELTSNPAILRCHGGMTALGVGPLDGVSLVPHVAFARQYLDTPYGQFAVAQTAFFAFCHDTSYVLTDLYPSLGRLIEMRPQQDFVTQHARLCYLFLENLLEDPPTRQMRIDLWREFEKSLNDPPAWILKRTQRMIRSEELAVKYRIPVDPGAAAPLIKRLADRGELPTPLEARARRHAIALGRQP